MALSTSAPSSPLVGAIGAGSLAAAACGAATAAVLYGSSDAARCESKSCACSTLGTELKKLQLSQFMDKDGDGKISEAELHDMFHKLDENKDGKITLEEWHDFLIKSGFSKDKCDQLEKVFMQLDKDGSGSISKDEFIETFHPDYACAARALRSAHARRATPPNAA